MAVVTTLVQWAVFALAAIWAISTNIALRKHYKNSDQPALPANVTALTQLTGVVAVAVAGCSPARSMIAHWTKFGLPPTCAVSAARICSRSLPSRVRRSTRTMPRRFERPSDWKG
jgi:hypothetical protein